MVQLIPTNNNPTKNEINVYICEMLNTNKYNYNVLNNMIREIRSKTGVGAPLHPSEEYFVSSFNLQLNSAKNMWLEDLRLPDQRYNFDMAYNDW